MKQVIIIIIAFLNTTNVISQDYIPMAVDNATWLMGSTHEDPQFDVLIVLRIEGDSIVNNLSYSKIYHYDYVGNKILLQTRKLLGLLRDDIDERKVYGGLLGGIQYGFETFLNFEAQCDWGDINTFNEHLLYDFGVQEGDTINSCMLSNSAVVSSIEEIDRFGYLRRNLSLDDDQYTIMTEGIGTCIGIFKGQECFYTGGGFSYALFNYCIGPFSECNLLTSIKEDLSFDQLYIYPNPVSEKLFIKSSTNTEKLFLLNNQGRLIETYMNVNYIDLRNYPSGLYILKVEDKSGRTYSKKVIKI